MPPSWSIPDACAGLCQYTFSYWAPALRCTPLSADQITDQTSGNLSQFPAQLANWTLGNSNDDAFVYSATSNLPAHGQSANLTDAYSFTIAFLPPDDKPQGASCVFYNATYTVQTEFDGHAPSSTINIAASGSNLTDPWTQPNTDCPWPSNQNTGAQSGQSTLSPCLTEALNARAMASSFVNVFRGTLQWRLDEIGTAARIASVFDVDFTGRNISVSSSASFAPTHFIPDQSAATTLSPLCQWLQALIAYTTLGGLTRTEQTQFIDVSIDEGGSIYRYTPVRLWAAYGSVILLTALCGLYGLHSLRTNPVPTALAFSDRIGFTQTPGMAALMARRPDGGSGLTAEQKEQTEVEFGQVDVGEKGRVLAFGVVGEDDIVPLQIHKV